MDAAWFVLGVLTTVSCMGVYKVYKAMTLSWAEWSALVSGILLVLFSLAWGAGSYFEGVPRAASMGFVVFGIPGVLLLLISGKRMAAKRTTGGQ